MLECFLISDLVTLKTGIKMILTILWKPVSPLKKKSYCDFLSYNSDFFHRIVK